MANTNQMLLEIPDFQSMVDTRTHPLYTEDAVSELRDRLKTSKGDREKRYDEKTKGLLQILENESNQRKYLFHEQTLTKLNTLSEEMPNFKPVIDMVAGAVSLAQKRNKPVEMTPILVEGSAGIGKTHFANRLSEILSVPFCSHDMASAQNVAALAGSDKHWANSEIGDVLNTLLTGDHLSPVFMLDELDKASYGNNLGDPLSSLYGLLEPENASSFRDRSFPIPVNARHIIWIATANDVSVRIPRPLLSRFSHIRVETPNPEQRRKLSKNFINERILKHKEETQESIHVEEEVIDVLSDFSPRKQKQCIEQMMNELARRDARRLSMSLFPNSLFKFENEGGTSDIGVGFLGNVH